MKCLQEPSDIVNVQYGPFDSYVPIELEALVHRDLFIYLPLDFGLHEHWPLGWSSVELRDRSRYSWSSSEVTVMSRS
eukprot:jgi/Psemu1/58058/gm1.58058_g